MRTWRLLSDVSASMPYQMALDEILLRRFKEDRRKKAAATEPLLRFFFSDGAWTTVGYFYPDAGGLPGNLVCRRLTGGGRVLHGTDLLLALIAHRSDDPGLEKVLPSYRKIHQAVWEGLREAGLEARFYEPGEIGERGTDCFRQPIESDLAYGARKLAGGAQKRSEGCLLHEESIQIQDLAERSKLRRAVLRGVEKVFGIKIRPEVWDPEILDQAKGLARQKYENPDFVCGLKGEEREP